MHPFSVLTLGIFVAGYITARWDLVTRLYELAIFAWDHGVLVSAVWLWHHQPVWVARLLTGGCRDVQLKRSQSSRCSSSSSFYP